MPVRSDIGLTPEEDEAAAEAFRIACGGSRETNDDRTSLDETQSSDDNLKKCDIQWCVSMTTKGKAHCAIHEKDPTYRPSEANNAVIIETRPNTSDRTQYVQVKCVNCHTPNSVPGQAKWYQCHACKRYIRFGACPTTKKTVTVQSASACADTYRCPHCGSMHSVRALSEMGGGPAAVVDRKAGPSSATITKIIVVAAVVVVVCVMGGVFYLVDSLFNPSAVTEPAELTVTATTLVSDYAANEVAADERYKGKVIAVTGEVSDISKSVTNSVHLSLARGKIDVSLYEGDASTLSKGDTVSVRGKCVGLVLGIVAVDRAVLKE